MERKVVSPDSALASDIFDQFCTASTLKSVLALHRRLMDACRLRPTNFPQFYPKLKHKLGSWRAQALWTKFDKRASHKCYARGHICANSRVLIIGAGPCGLRAAVEAQLLGAKVVVVEKRDRISRNNVLHLWPFVIHDLRALGAKKFFGKFCAGSIDHISIRQLQCMLLKVALLLGVEVHVGVSFEKLLTPPEDQTERVGWRAEVSPADHPVAQYEFDVLIGADGKRNTLEGFGRKEFRGKLAIAITANFLNRRSEAEARVEEISGVAFIFNQKFFKDLYAETGIDLENIVYYKDDTHYFVMTAKKQSLLEKGVIIADQNDTARLLSLENVNKEALMQYAREAADFSTRYQLPSLDFAVNHYGQPDVAMFDFTSMYAAENATKVLEKNGHRLLMQLVGDSLLEPFWPTGSGCARGFLSSMDACWALRSWCLMSPLEVAAERESIYRLLGQTTPENLSKDFAAYTLEPHTRYPNLNLRAVLPVQVRNLINTDNQATLEVMTTTELPTKRRRKDSQVHPDTLLQWLKRQVALYENVKIENVGSSFRDGMALCAIIHRYRPDLLDFASLKPEDAANNCQLVFDKLNTEYGITPVMTGAELASSDQPDHLTMLSYLSQVYDAFRGEIPHLRTKTIDEQEEVVVAPVRRPLATRVSRTSLSQRKRSSLERGSTPELLAKTSARVPRKRRSHDKDIGDQRRAEIEHNREDRAQRRRMMRHMTTQRFVKSMQMLQAGEVERDRDKFEDMDIAVYRQHAPRFTDRVKQMEKKLLYPDREPRAIGEVKRGGPDENFSSRIKEIEMKFKGTAPVEKKPRDLHRSIGKIESTDWNVAVIERKMEENKMGRNKAKGAEKVPKWNREKFADKFSAVEKKLRGRSKEDDPDKFAHIDQTLKQLDRKIREGSVLDSSGPRGANKVSAMAEQLATKLEPAEVAPTNNIQKSSSKTVVLPQQGGSENCHFCKKRVYLMERLSAEGRFFHRGCFRCEYCGTSLRPNNYAFDRDGKYGSRFVCTQHFGLPGFIRGARARRKSEDLRAAAQQEIASVAPSTPASSATLDQSDGKVGATPERVEFENFARGAGSEDDLSEAPPLSAEMDEDAWTDHNFGASCADDDSSSGEEDDLSETDSSDSDAAEYEEALGEPLSVEETRQLAENWKRRYSQRSQEKAEGSDLSEEEEEESSEDEWSCERDELEDEDSSTATEGDAVARELLRQEERLRERALRRRNRSQGSDTEVNSDCTTTDSDSEEEEEEENLATEIETDSEFELDSSLPTIVIDSELQVCHVKTGDVRGNLNPKQTPHKSSVPSRKQPSKPSAPPPEMTPAVLKHRPNNFPGLDLQLRKKELLNRTSSTEGIASKMSLELKKRYLLGGESNVFNKNVQKSGSASALDSRFRSFVDQISEQQKLLQPAANSSPPVQTTYASPLLTSMSTSNILQNNRSDLMSNIRGETTSKLPKVPSSFVHICGKKENPATLLSPPEIKITPEIDDEATPIVESKDIFNIDKIAQDNSQDNNIVESESDKILDLETEKKIIEVDDDLTPNVECKEVIEDANILDPDYRPRSPAHETSIIVPDISEWKMKAEVEEVEEESSETSESSSEYDEDSVEEAAPIKKATEEGVTDEEQQAIPTTAAAAVPRLEITDSEGKLASPEKPEDDTELSDWAHEVDVGDFDEFTIETKNITFRRKNKQNNKPTLAIEDDLSEISLTEDMPKVDIMIVSETKSEIPKLEPEFSKIDVMSITDTKTDDMKPIGATIEDIDFMDSGEDDDDDDNSDLEISSPEKINSNSETKNVPVIEGYRKLSDGIVNTDIIIPANDSSTTESISKSSDDFGTTPDTELENLVLVEAINAKLAKTSDEESLLLVDTDTTTSDVTTLVLNDLNQNLASSQTKRPFIDPSYEAHVKRLQGRISPFSNAKDSIDIRKSRKSSTTSSSTPSPSHSARDDVKPMDNGVKSIRSSIDNGIKSLDYIKSLEDNVKCIENNVKLIDSSLKSIENGAKSDKLLHENGAKSLDNSLKSVENTSKCIDNSAYNKYSTPLVLKITENDNHNNILITSKDIKTNENSKLKETELSPRSILNTPSTSRKLEEISKERSKNKDLIADLVIGKLGTNSIERKRSLSGGPIRKRLSSKSPTGSPRCSLIGPPPPPVPPPPARIKLEDMENVMPKYEPKDIPLDDDVFLTPKNPSKSRPISVYASFKAPEIKSERKLPETPLTHPEAFSCPDIRRALFVEENRERAREQARARARLMSDQELGLSPENTATLSALREKTRTRSRDESETPVAPPRMKKKSQDSSIEEAKSEPVCKRSGKKSKDRERRKSLIQAMSEFFTRKSSPSKSKSKEREEQPPPLPPPPQGYQGCQQYSLGRDESREESPSEGEESRGASCSLESGSSLRRSSRSAKKQARQAQLKRLRMAHELQRQMEELEEKQRILESRGVQLEKAIRGEDKSSASSSGGEVALLQEWFELMRERSELRRYERELGVRAQELELQERHANLQTELRDRMAVDDGSKSTEEVAEEGRILAEMLEIVERRDSLIVLLEQERQRYVAEEQDLEAQMLAKGLRLTPLRKESHV